MKAEAAMPLELGAFLADTLGLSNGEVGSYILLIMAYWANGGPLPNDDKSLQTAARCPDSEWIRTRGLLSQKFQVQNGTWSHKRIDSEITKSKARKLTMTELSQLGVEARRQMGQLPPRTNGQPSCSPTVQRISDEKELERVIKRLEELRNQGTTVAGGRTTYTTPQRAELSTLKARRDELRQALGVVV